MGPSLRRQPARAQPWSAANICSRCFLASPLVSLIAAEDSCACVMSSFVIVAAIYWRRSSTDSLPFGAGWSLQCGTWCPDTCCRFSTLPCNEGAAKVRLQDESRTGGRVHMHWSHAGAEVKAIPPLDLRAAGPLREGAGEHVLNRLSA